MKSWSWVDKKLLSLLHDESLVLHGGSCGLRDEGLLDSALARARNLSAYGQLDAAELAATYAFRLAKNHPFVDGNKRAAFLALGLFLGLNGLRLTATQVEATLVIFALAAGDLAETGLSTWLRTHCAPR